MGRHSKPGVSFWRRGIAGTSIAALASSPLIFLPGSVLATDDCSSIVNGIPGASGVLLTGDVCELRFTASVASLTTLPSGITKLSVLAVGGGEGAQLNSFGYAGAGGQLSVLDDVLGGGPLPASYKITVGAAGADGGGDGGFTSLEDPDEYLVTAVGGGWAGSWSSYGYSIQGGLDGGVTFNESRNGSFDLAGAGTGGDASHPNGGAGVATTKTEVAAALDDSLWTASSSLPSGQPVLTFDFGKGGDIKAVPGGATNLYGHGASATSDGSVLGTAGQGILIMRFQLPGVSQSPGPAAVSVPYMGPIGLNLAGQNTCVGDLATVSGSRLGSIDKIYIDNTSVPFTLVSDERITFTVPDMKAGSYQVKFWVPVNSVNLTDSITIGACGQAPVESETPEPDTGSQPDETEVEAPEAAKPFYVAKRFTNYRGDRGPVVAADRVAITNFINANPGLTNVTCVGSTSGVPVIETDEALAMARAKNACSIVESLVPGVETRLVTNTGRGVGQFYRAVTLFGKGTTAN